MESGAVWVRVSLGAYFSDERARCMMMVPGGGGARRAGWLARRLRRTFGLPRRPALLCQGHLLPPAEPLPTRAPLLQLEAVPPSGRVVDVSRQRASDDDSDSQAVRVRAKRRRQASDQSEPAPAPAASSTANAKPASDENRQPEETSELADADEKDDVDGLSSPSLNEMKRRALELLEGQAGGRRRRHRVRRRRGALTTPAVPAAPQPEVLHNEEGSRRAPRHVRALSPAPAERPPPPSPPPLAAPASPCCPMTEGHNPLLPS